MKAGSLTVLCRIWFFAYGFVTGVILCGLLIKLLT